MLIKIEDLKSVIDELVEDTLSQLNGDLSPKIDERVAILKLGQISALCIILRDKVEDAELKDQIWNLKKESDKHLEQLFNK
ncbi:hypothetical protein M2444_004951 [Paenibacillus sp. PastF-3]|uniref:hypothetical protein n=1 Tax=unclassified Paenibacillus TaxID=185978 RepID=UPI000BA0FF66|nr:MULTISPECIES: hypothetical protein [unclassified Paenibacillus]MDH6373121.1 hypothetical protein [Paenibacillus sp. PastF-3]OZQ97334.1 hypothetical protein CA598_05950 [Paenibacillus sp. VTT E-133291]